MRRGLPGIFSAALLNLHEGDRNSGLIIPGYCMILLFCLYMAYMDDRIPFANALAHHAGISSTALNTLYCTSAATLLLLRGA